MKQFSEHIDEALQDANVFLYSLVIEAWVEAAVKVEKVYGIRSAESTSQSFFFTVPARRGAPSGISNLRGASHETQLQFLEIYSEVLELKRHTVVVTRADLFL